jgi:predicted NBD/HSP70 family sugar kinase
MQHEQFQDLLNKLVKRSGVGQEVLGEVLARTSLHAPEETSRTEISAGNPAARRPVDQRAIPQGTVSKAVRALMEAGLLEEGEKFLRSPDGRVLSPLRFGSAYVIAGAKIVQSTDRRMQVTTALFGLDRFRVLGIENDVAANWEQAAGLIHRHVTSLMTACNRDRVSRRLRPLLMFGVGVVVAAPVLGGELMQFSFDKPESPVPLSEKLHRLFETDRHSIPVILENDCNALAVLASHEIHYTDPDLVVVSVSDEGVRGGLVMDGRLRRGAYGQAMEIGHLAVGYPPGMNPDQDLDELQSRTAYSTSIDAGFKARCSCGKLGHVDTYATPSRIQEEFGDGSLDQMCEIDALDPSFKRAQEIFRRSGSALGRALAYVTNTVNPSRIIIYLPAPLAEPRPDTAATAYLTAARAEALNVFAAGHQEPEYLRIRKLPPAPSDMALLGARAAAECVLESFIEHALRLDGCSLSLRRTATSHHSVNEIAARP